MKGLKSVIRLNRWGLEQQRKQLADLEGRAQGYRQALAQIDTDIKSEAPLTEGSFDLTTSFNSYLSGQLKRREAITADLAALEEEIAEARTRVGQAFRKLKAFELALANRIEAKERIVRRREQDALDDVGRDTHRRERHI